MFVSPGETRIAHKPNLTNLYITNSSNVFYVLKLIYFRYKNAASILMQSGIDADHIDINVIGQQII